MPYIQVLANQRLRSIIEDQGINVMSDPFLNEYNSCWLGETGDSTVLSTRVDASLSNRRQQHNIHAVDDIDDESNIPVLPFGRSNIDAAADKICDIKVDKFPILIWAISC